MCCSCAFSLLWMCFCTKFEQKMIIFWLCITLLISVLNVGDVETLKCYVATRNNQFETTEKECVKPHIYNNTVCKTTTTIVHGNIVDTVQDCAQWSGEILCASEATIARTVETCYCKRDLCNGGRRARGLAPDEKGRNAGAGPNTNAADASGANGLFRISPLGFALLIAKLL